MSTPAASQMNDALDAHAKVRVWSALKCQVSGSLPSGQLAGSPTSSAVRMVTVSSLALAAS